jgi:AAA domain
MSKIRSVSIINFRGIVGEVTINLTKGSKSASALLLGDNGCGKSSILDAIGFCLRGQLYGTGFSPRAGSPTLRNLIAPTQQPSFVTVDLDSGEKVSRSIQPGERHSHDKPAHSDFRYSPILVRRRDLLRFTELGTGARSSYLASFGSISLLTETSAEVRSLQEQLDELAMEKSKLELAVIRLTGADKSNFPRTAQKFASWVYSLRGGTPNLSRQERKKLPQLAPDIKAPVQRLNALYPEISKLRKQIHAKNSGKNMEKLTTHLETISKDVTAAFLKLCPQSALVKRLVFLNPDTRTPRVSLTVELPNGYLVSPSNILSEASLDLLALLTYLYAIKASAVFGQGKVIVLDDVFSSVDSTVRAKVAQHLFDEFRDWQLILSFHDRLWYEQFRRAAGSANVDILTYEFGRWSLASGPTIYQAPQDASARLRRALVAPEPDRGEIAGSTGILLETLCNFLTVNLSLMLPRRLDQRYDIGDMWPAVVRSLGSSSIAPYVSRVNDVVHLRNLAGAHFNEWATNLSLDEVLDFAQAVIELWEHVFCTVCHNYIKRRGGVLRCVCGTVTVN